MAIDISVYREVIGKYPHYTQNPCRECNRDILLLFHLLWFANRAALEAMDQPLPPRPVLFLGLMLILKPSSSENFFRTSGSLTPCYNPLTFLMAISSDTESVGGDTHAARQASIPKHGKGAFPANCMPAVAAMPERFGVTVSASCKARPVSTWQLSQWSQLEGDHRTLRQGSARATLVKIYR